MADGRSAMQFREVSTAIRKAAVFAAEKVKLGELALSMTLDAAGTAGRTVRHLD